jgi:hypothetical protein
MKNQVQQRENTGECVKVLKRLDNIQSSEDWSFTEIDRSENGRFQRMVAFREWSFGEWSPSGIGRSGIGRSEIGRSANGRSENGRCTVFFIQHFKRKHRKMSNA